MVFPATSTCEVAKRPGSAVAAPGGTVLCAVAEPASEPSSRTPRGVAVRALRKVRRSIVSSCDLFRKGITRRFADHVDHEVRRAEHRGVVDGV